VAAGLNSTHVGTEWLGRIIWSWACGSARWPGRGHL